MTQPDRAMDPFDRRQALHDAVEAARAAGALIRRMARRRLDAQIKTSARDVVTEADFASERLILDHLRARYPDHGLRAEESGTSAHNSEYLWVVDPLDGTSNFAHGFPHYGISIALLYRGRSIVGVVHDPTRREMFTAIAGGGARLNGRRLSVSAVDDLAGSMVTTGFPYEPPAQRAAVADLSARVIERAQMFRRTGSAALDLAYVAAGRTEAHFEFGVSLHDIAAGVLLVAEAGGRVEEMRLAGYRDGYITSNGRGLHDEVLDLHRRYLGPVLTAASSLIQPSEAGAA